MVTVAAGGQTRVEPQLTPSGEMREDALLRWPLAVGEQRYGTIDGLRLKTFMNDVVGISLKSRSDGNKYWGRIAGTKYEAMTADWVEAHFKRLGMADVSRVKFPLPAQWRPTDWTLTASAGAKTLGFKSALPALGSQPTAAAGIVADAVWAGLGTEADFIGRNVRGKTAVIQTMLAPGQMGHSANWESAIKRAESNGAAAVVVIWGYAENFAVWQGLGGYRSEVGADGRTRRVSEPVRIPGFFVGWEDGKALRDLIAEGQPVKVTARVQREMHEGLESVSVYGTLPGTTDEKIYVLAHMDGYFQAASDNASGVAVMVGLAEYFAKTPPQQRRRSIVFVGTAGHHVGSPNSPYLRDKGLLSKTALMINCEHVAPLQTVTFSTKMRLTTQPSARRWWVNGSDKLRSITLDAYRTFGVAVVGDMDNSATGEMGAIDEEAPSIQVIRSPENKHTDGDIPERVSVYGLEAVTRAFAKVVDEVNKLDLAEIVPRKATTTSAMQDPR